MNEFRYYREFVPRVVKWGILRHLNVKYENIYELSFEHNIVLLVISNPKKEAWFDEKVQKMDSVILVARKWATVTLLLCFSISSSTGTFQQCSDKDGGGYCPLGNACCPYDIGKSGCISNDMPGGDGTCCLDDTSTGCAFGYTCETGTNGSLTTQFCLRDVRRVGEDPLVMTMPRYKLCFLPNAAQRQLHGMPVILDVVDRRFQSPVYLLYYSSHGNVFANCKNDDDNNDTIIQESIRIVVIVVHGSGRNADDYFCSTLTAANTLQKYHSPTSILVLAPLFATFNDIPTAWTNDATTVNKKHILLWDDTDSEGTWRYGASPISPLAARDVSSFAVMDQMISLLQLKYRNIRLITVVGHSSGGQFVQRWSLLSNLAYWDIPSYIKNDIEKPHLRAVVANPSSYAYPDNRRFLNGQWSIPTTLEEKRQCPQYNQWEWGLDPGGDKDIVYKHQTLQQVGGVAQLTQRFLNRSVVYLSGGADRCNASSTNAVVTTQCYSHGLETKCGDEMQGPNRFERNRYYFDLMERLSGKVVVQDECHMGDMNHYRFVVEGVGHDHSLMFQSIPGLMAIFGELPLTTNKTIISY